MRVLECVGEGEIVPVNSNDVVFDGVVVALWNAQSLRCGPNHIFPPLQFHVLELLIEGRLTVLIQLYHRLTAMHLVEAPIG